MAKKSKLMVEVLPCTTITTYNGKRKVAKWQGHAYYGNKKGTIEEPVISGNPAVSEKMATELLEVAIEKYITLGREVQAYFENLREAERKRKEKQEAAKANAKAKAAKEQKESETENKE